MITPDIQPDAPVSQIVPDAQPIRPDSAAPQQQGTALPFDDIISREAEKAGIPASFAVNIGRIESGGIRDRARAASPAGAVGVMQLMPGTAKDLGVKDITDPTQNIQGGVKYLAQLYKKYNGDTKAVAAAYNMGPGAYDEYRAGKRAMPEETANYINKINPIPVDAPQGHKDLGADGLHHVQHVMDTFIRAQKRGKNPWQAIGRTPEIRPIAKTEHNAQSHLQWFRDHPLEGLADIVGSPQRAVGQVLENMSQHPHSPEAVFHDVWDSVINPTEKAQARTTRGLADEIATETHGRVRVPDHRQIDDAIHAHVWEPLQGPTRVAAKAGTDMALQFFSDPLSLPGGLIERGLRAAGGVARAVHGLMPVQAASKWAHLPQIASTMEHYGGMAFGVRRDLDATGFTRQGKQMRIALENSELTRAAKNAEANKAVAHDPVEATRQYVDYMAEHGSARNAQLARQHPLHSSGVAPNAPHTASAGPHDFALDEQELADTATAADRRQEILDDVSRTIKRNELGRRSEQLFAGKPNLYTGQPGQLKGLDTSDKASDVQKFLDSSPFKILRDIGKKAITWNPAPHGLKNVGTLTYLAGGLPAVARGLAAMTHPIEHSKILELEEMGALPKYLGAAAKNPIEHWSQNAIEHMEAGWRVGLKETLDKKLGVPQTEEEKLLRGWLINNKVGDYRNQSAFVKMFQALGGPFVAFRLGIVPARVAEAAIKNPERLAAMTRGPMDLQHDRDKQGQRQNELTLGGPVEDEAKLLANPSDFLSKTLGSLGSLGKDGAGTTPQGLMQMGANLAASYIPGVSGFQEYLKDAQGAERPNQKVQLSDQLLDAILSTFGAYYKKKMTPKQEAAKYKKIQKGSI